MAGTAKYSEPFQGKDDKWYWHLRATNGEVVSQSEGYETREGAEKGINAAIKASQEAYEPPEAI